MKGLIFIPALFGTPFISCRRIHNPGEEGNSQLNLVWIVGENFDLYQMKPLPYELLYDTESDLYEIRNITGSDLPENQEAVFRLRSSQETRLEETGDQGIYLEDSTIENINRYKIDLIAVSFKISSKSVIIFVLQ